MATRYIEGGRATVLAYIQLAAMNGNDSAMTWWHVFEGLSKYEKSQVSYDDVCAASGIPPKNILMAIAGAGFDANCDIANLISSHLHPKVVEASGKAAMKADGIEDRKLLMMHQGFIPAPKGASVIINNSAVSNANALAQAQGNPSVPSFLDDIEDLGPVTKVVQGEIIEAQIKALPATSATDEADWHAKLDLLKAKEAIG